MIIDQGKLMALLVEKTGQSKQEVGQQLDRLKERIQKVISSGKLFKIEGFGTFLKREGALHFEPTEQLKTEINQKYAGMPPLELMEAFKESGAGIPVEEEPKVLSAEDKPRREEAPVASPAPPPVDEDKATEKEEVNQPQKKRPKPQKAKPAAASSAQKKKSAKNKKPAASAMRRPQSDPLGKVLLVLVAGIVILGAGWLLYQSGVLQPSHSRDEAALAADSTAQKSSPHRLAITAADSDSVGKTGAQSDTTEQNGTGLVSRHKAAEGKDDSSTYGLKGAVNKQVKSAYTIVIHSFRLKSTVQSIADSLRNENYRTVLFEGSVESESRWRLGLGQFKTVDAAQQAAQTLPNPYKDNHFIKRFNLQ